MTLKVTIEDKKIIVPEDTALTPDAIRRLVSEHKSKVAPKAESMKRMYVGDYPILRKPRKAQYKPDHRLVANFGKYLVDTFTGYFAGLPVKVTHRDDDTDSWVQDFAAYCGLEDLMAETAKACDMYGYVPMLLYMDEDSMPCMALSTPTESFVVYDDSILHRPMWGIRYYKNGRNRLEGTVSDDTTVYRFVDTYNIVDEWEHPFGGVPIIEFTENSERIGLIESVETLLDEYCHALSEKANDVDYYADAYLKVLGKKIDPETLKALRDNRIINMSGKDTDKIIVEFLAKPDADATTEHLLDRLERLIFSISMVADIGEQDFGNASGTALAYRLQPMDNLAKMKARKFTASLQSVFRLISHVPTSRLSEDDWMNLRFDFTQNIPRNLLEESQIAQNLQGIVSDETLLRVLSVVKDVKAEIEKKQKNSAE